MKELIYRENTNTKIGDISVYKQQFQDSEITLEEYKSLIKEIVKK